MNIFSVNFLAIIACGIIYLIFGWLWYSPKLIGAVFYPPSEIKKQEKGEMKAWQFVACFVEAFIMSWALSLFILWLNPTLTGAVIIGVVAWIGFILTTLFSGFVWGGMHYRMFLMHAIYYLIFIIIASLVLGSWR